MKRRCAFEGSRFDSNHFKSVSGFLVHMTDDAGSTPVEPVHEAIEGRLLEHIAVDAYRTVNIPMYPPMLLRRP